MIDKEAIDKKMNKGLKFRRVYTFNNDVLDIGFDIPKTKRENWTNRKKKDKNIETYSDWVVKIIKEVTDSSAYWKLKKKFIKKEYQANSCAIYMNRNNLDKLHDCFHSMDWLNLSPTTDDSLKDNQYAVEINKALLPRIK